MANEQVVYESDVVAIHPSVRVPSAEYQEFLVESNGREAPAENLLEEIKKVEGVDDEHIACLNSFIARWKKSIH